MAQRIDGKAIAVRLTDQIAEDASTFAKRAGRPPGLTVILVGEDPASAVYVRSKGKMAEKCGFKSETKRFATDLSEAGLLVAIDALNADPAVDGILVQLPLPPHIDPDKVIEAIDPAKDVDGFHPVNVGRVAIGQHEQAMAPCTPSGAMLLIESVVGADLSGKNALVIGRSNIVGKPMAQLLLAANATVTIAHSRTPDLPGLARRADVLVAAVGRPHYVKGDWIKPGAIVIDVGINRVTDPNTGASQLVGDIDFEAANQHASAITPVPGGVGPMTIALLMANTLHAANRREGLTD